MSKRSLPRGWKWVALEEVVGPAGVFTDGDWVESKDQDPNGEVRLVQLADVGDGAFLDKSNRSLTMAKAKELSCTFLEEGDILVSRMGDPLTRACLYPGGPRPAVTVVDVVVVRVRRDDVDSRWLMHSINTVEFRCQADFAAGGATRQRIPRSKLGRICIPLPPLAMQRRIVARVREAMERVEEGLRLASDNAQCSSMLPEEALADLWAQQSVGRARHVPLGMLGSVVTGATPKTSDPRFWDGEIPWITPADMDGARVVERARKHVSVAAVDLRAARRVDANSVAVVCIGSVGKVALCGVNLCVNQQINVITFNAEVEPRFGYWACRALKGEIIGSAKQSTLPILNKSAFSALKIPVPLIETQRSIANALDGIHDRAQQLAEHARQRAGDFGVLKQSILRHAFAGEL